MFRCACLCVVVLSKVTISDAQEMHSLLRAMVDKATEVPTWVVRVEPTTANLTAAATTTLRSGRIIEGHRELWDRISRHEVTGDDAEVSSYWALRLSPGRYRVTFQKADALWHNRCLIGTVSDEEFGADSGPLIAELGTIDNRHTRLQQIDVEHGKINALVAAPTPPLEFELDGDRPVPVRFAFYCLESNYGEWKKSAAKIRTNGHFVEFWPEDGADLDYDDLVVRLERQ